MTNPIIANSISIFEVVAPKKGGMSTDGHAWQIAKIITTYGKSGNCACYAFWGFSDQVIGRAGGYGYDKTSTALANALEFLGIDHQANGMAGFERVREAAEKIGYKLTKIV